VNEALQIGISELEKYPFHIEVGVRHTDLDIQKCVNNVALANIFEEARTQYSVARKLKRAFDPSRRQIDSLTIIFGEDGGYPGLVLVHVGISEISAHTWTLQLVATQKDRVIAVNACTFKLLNAEGSTVDLPAQLMRILEQDRLVAR